MTSSSDKDTYLITGEQLEKLKWNCGSASPAMHDLEPIIRSRPYNPEQEKAAAINGVLDRVRKELKACMDCEAWLKENQYVTWDDIEATLAELHQQAEEPQQRGRGE